MVFVHRNEDAQLITAKLAYRGIAAADLHSSCSKMERQRTLQDFRSGRVRLLVASDVAARGIDVAGVTHIINVDAPTRSKDYLHRTGRTGRAGAPGAAVSLMTAPDMRLVRRYEEELGITMVPVRLHGGELLKLSAERETNGAPATLRRDGQRRCRRQHP
jgi:superfamily II DNA/RNA helicase